MTSKQTDLKSNRLAIMMITTAGIRATGLYLLELLHQTSPLPYSKFYGDQGEEDVLAKGALPFVRADETEDVPEEDLLEEGHVMLESAAWQFEDLGLVRIVSLDTELIDETRDFRIELTEKGKGVSAADLEFNFRRDDYTIDASSASHWLIAFLEASDELDLQTVMKYGDSEAEVLIPDNYENSYSMGSGTYAWAFEVALWHHARNGVIVPVGNQSANDKIWTEFVRSSDRPARPDVSSPHPVWDTPFRLAEGVNVNKVVHVRTVS